MLLSNCFHMISRTFNLSPKSVVRKPPNNPPSPPSPHAQTRTTHHHHTTTTKMSPLHPPKISVRRFSLHVGPSNAYETPPHSTGDENAGIKRGVSSRERRRRRRRRRRYNKLQWQSVSTWCVCVCVWRRVARLRAITARMHVEIWLVQSSHVLCCDSCCGETRDYIQYSIGSRARKVPV